MVAPTVSDTTVNAQISNSTTLTVNMPTTRPDGDFFLCISFKDDDPAWTGIPSNWTEIFQEADPTNIRLGAWYWIGDNEPASYTLTMDSEIGTAIVLRIDGARLDNPIDDFDLAEGSGANQLAPASDVTVDDTLVIRCIALDKDAVTASQPTTLTVGGGDGAADVGHGVSRELGPTAPASTGTSQFTHAVDEFVAATIVIAPFIPFISGNLSDVAFPAENSFVGPFEI